MKSGSSSRVSRLLLCMVAMVVLLTGCWDSNQLDRLSFTVATAVDYKDGNWILSFQIVVPSAVSPNSPGGQGRIPISVVSSQGKTIREAVWRSQLEITRELYFSHTRTIIISEAAAQRGLSPLMDVYFRNQDSRETVSVLITAGKAREILDQLIQLEILPGEGIEDMIAGEAKEMSILPNINMYKLALSLLGTAKSGVLPEILISGTSPVKKMDDLNTTDLGSKLRLGRLAVLSHDKHVGWLSQKEAFGVNFIRNEVKKTALPFACAANSKQPDSTFRILSSKTHLTPHKTAGHFIMDVDVKAQGVLLETDCPIDFNRPNSNLMLEKQLEQVISALMLSAWDAVRKLETDVVGFASLTERKYPQEWKKLKPNWSKEFVRIELNPKVDVKIKRPGLIMKSYKKQSEQD